MYTRCPSCRAEISFEPPANMESLPDGYKHRIKCPSCGVTIGVKINKIQFKAVTASIDLEGHKCLLMKPQTFMNNSGEAVREAASFYKIPPERIIIVFDDISLPCGKMRIRRKGSDGGHNGMKSIIYQMNSDAMPRIKLGIGQKPHPDYELADWVLSSFKKDELDALRDAAENACAAAVLMVNGETEKAMSSFNS